jgi:hypothetical protein
MTEDPIETAIPDHRRNWSRDRLMMEVERQDAIISVLRKAHEDAVKRANEAAGETRFALFCTALTVGFVAVLTLTIVLRIP